MSASADDIHSASIGKIPFTRRYVIYVATEPVNVLRVFSVTPLGIPTPGNKSPQAVNLHFPSFLGSVAIRSRRSQPPAVPDCWTQKMRENGGDLSRTQHPRFNSAFLLVHGIALDFLATQTQNGFLNLQPRPCSRLKSPQFFPFSQGCVVGNNARERSSGTCRERP